MLEKIRQFKKYQVAPQTYVLIGFITHIMKVRFHLATLNILKLA